MKRTLINKYLHPLAPLPTSLSARGDLKAPIKSILFDIYGTLFISDSGDINSGRHSSAAHNAINRLLAKYAIRKTSRRIFDKLYGAIESRHRVLRSNGVDHPEVIIEQIWRHVLEIEDQTIIRQFAVEFELIANPVWAMPHLESMLSALRQKKMLMGIISNAQFYTPYLFDWFLNSDPEGLGFDPGLLFYSYQHEVAKPSLFLFKMAAEKLNSKGILPVSVLYVGNDMVNDIYPATATGFQTALFAGDRRSLRMRTGDSRCIDLAPDLVVTDLGQLSQMLPAQ